MTEQVRPDPLAAAQQELRETIARARAALDRVRSRPLLTADEKRELDRLSLGGELGRDMRDLAEHIRAGRTTWAEAIEGISPYSHLLREHAELMVSVHGEAVRRALAADEDFDPFAPHDDV